MTVTQKAIIREMDADEILILMEQLNTIWDRSGFLTNDQHEQRALCLSNYLQITGHSPAAQSNSSL